MPEIMRQQRCGHLFDPGPLRTHSIGRRKHCLPPGLDALRMHNNCSQLDSLQRSSLNPSLIECVDNIKDSTKIEAAARDQPLHLSVALLLLIDPLRIGTGPQGAHPCSPQRRLRTVR